MISSFHFSNAEILCAAEQQLEAAQGINETLFVTFKLTLDSEGKPLVDAWQVCVKVLILLLLTIYFFMYSTILLIFTFLVRLIFILNLDC